MTRAGDKVPFSMPTTGVVSDQHPFAVAQGQLVKCQNWVNEDGIFRTRNGLIALDPAKRWYELLTISDNLVPLGLAEAAYAGLSLLNFNSHFVDVSVTGDDAIVGDSQYLAKVMYDPGDEDTDVRTDTIEASPGLYYTAWVFTDGTAVAGDITLEFLDADGEVISAHELSGDPVAYGLWKTTQTAPQQTDSLRLCFYPTFGHDLTFGPMKIAQAEEIIAWSYGDGYSGDPGQNLFDISVAHPEDSQEAITVWDQIEGKEQILSFTGKETLGVFDDYDNIPIVGRSVAYSAQPTQFLPSYDEITGLELAEDMRVSVSPGVSYKISASYFFGVEEAPILDMWYSVEVPFYNSAGNEITYYTLVRADADLTGAVPTIDARGRAELTFTAPGTSVKAGLRIKCSCPTAERQIVYDNYGEIVRDNLGLIVTIEGTNRSARRLGIVLDDVKMVTTVGADVRWWDFVLPTASHTGPYGEGEYATNYMLHDYLLEGVTESNRIVMASDKSVWKWNDSTDTWEQMGFDLGTIYTAWYLLGEDADGETTYTADTRFTFEETDSEGYTAQTGEPDELVIEVKLPAATEGSENPYPGGYWQYRVNSGDWSSQLILSGDTPVTETSIEFNGRTLPVKIVLDATDYSDFDDICAYGEDDDPIDDPIAEARIYSRKHDGQTGETAFNTDRDDPVDIRGYDFGQKTYLIFANPNDRVVAWDGQTSSKVERAGSNAPFAKTICISGGRVLAGNVIFDDPYADLVAPLAVVYTDTFLSRGFRNWHPELAIRLADTPGEVVKLLEMGTLAVASYKTDALYMLVYQTGNNPFRTQLMASNVPGPIAVRAVAPLTENTHLYLGQDGGIYTFDGSYPIPFSKSVSNTISSELDLTYKNRAFLAYSPRLGVVLAMYPTKGSEGRVNRGMWMDLQSKAGWPFEWDGTIFDFTAGAPVQTVSAYEMGGVTIRLGEMGSSLASGTALQPDFFMGGLDGTTYVMDEDARDDWHNAIKAKFRSGLTEFGLKDKFSILKEIELIVNRTTLPHTMHVDVWSSDYGIDAKVVSSETVDLQADGPYSVEVREKGRFWGYGIEVDASERIVFNGGFAAIRAMGYR